MEGLSSLGIDPLSILIYIVNTGLLIVVLVYVLYKPILKFLDSRRDRIRESVEEAQILKEELTKKAEEARAAEAHFEAQLKKETENLRKFGEEKRAQMEAEMATLRTEMLRKANEEIEVRKNELIKEVEETLLQLMKKVVLDTVKNRVPEEVVMESIRDAWKQYK
ncbi:MAG: hypothetical protein WC846_01075 [Candidatus Gracilibacteria bacterium]|jgi:F-type H+-transporting ATPase subunit b